jgi:hypothetical protein
MYSFENTSTPNASGKSNRLCTLDAIRMHRSARPIPERTAIVLLELLPRSRMGARAGATTAKGAMVKSK